MSKLEHILGETALKAIAIKSRYPCSTLADIGRELGVSRERVRQVLVRANIQTKIRKVKPFCKDCGNELTHYNIYERCQKCLTIYKSVPLVCDNCGRMFYRGQSEVIAHSKDIRYKGKSFCCKKCSGKYKSNNKRLMINE
jgi:predicted RNA-binding Zn-ribbon protein involved in translation (DUF1610 family)